MFKASNAATAATLARLEFKKWGMSIHDGQWYVGTYHELMEIGCLNAYDSLDDPKTVDENRPFKPALRQALEDASY